MRSQRGAILIVTLWLAAILGITAAALAYEQRTVIRVLGNQRDQAQAALIARGGAERVIGSLHAHGGDKTHAPTMDWWSAPRRYAKVPLGSGWFSVRPSLPAESSSSTGPSSTDVCGLADEESKLNVNNAPETVLAALKGLTPDLARGIVAKRKELSEKGRGGGSLVTTIAEAREEKKAASANLLDTPFRTLTDLLAVSGITAALLYGESGGRQPLARLLTTRSSGKVNVNSAPREILQALGVRDDGWQAVVRARSGTGFPTVDRFLEASGLQQAWGEEGGEEGGENPKAAAVRALLAVRSANFSCVSVGQLENGVRAAVEVSFRLDPERVRVTSWRLASLPPALDEKDRSLGTERGSN